MNERLFGILELPRAAVSINATVEEAVRELYASGLGGIAVLERDRVRGIFTEDDLLQAVFPRYLSELEHTSFLAVDEALVPQRDPASTLPVTQFVREVETVPLPTTAVDLAQRFLHTDAPALLAVRGDSFAGVIDQTDFCKAILRRYQWQL